MPYRASAGHFDGMAVLGPHWSPMLRKSPYYLPASQYGGGRKRIFIGLMLASCCVACLALAFFLILPWSDYGQTLTWLPLLCMLVGGAGILALLWMCGTLVWHVYTGRYLPGVGSVRHVTIRLFFPVMELLAQVVRMERRRVRHSFIKVNNELVLADRPRVWSPAPSWPTSPAPCNRWRTSRPWTGCWRKTAAWSASCSGRRPTTTPGWKACSPRACGGVGRREDS